MLHCFNLVAKNSKGKPPVYLIGSNHGCRDLLEDDMDEYECMFMQRVKLKGINEKKDVNRSKTNMNVS